MEHTSVSNCLFKGCQNILQHYHSFDEAKNAWKKRSKRMLELIENGANVNVIMIRKDFEGGEYQKFKDLSFENNIYISNDPRPI